MYSVGHETFYFKKYLRAAASENLSDAAWKVIQSIKSPVELNSLSKILLLYYLVYYITWLYATVADLQTRPLRQILLFLWNNGMTV